MSDVRAPFPMIEDTSSVGQVLAQAVNTVTDPTGLNGLIGFSFKDAAGNVVLPQLDSEGKLPVTFDSAGAIYRARGTVTDKDATLANLTGALIVLATSKTYINIGVHISCRRAAYFQLVQLNDVTETILYDSILDSGQYTDNIALPVDQIVTGATGTQSIRIKCQTFEKASNVYATISCKEVS